ncbi:hypothetical protein [Streptomyces sp. NPDC088910]|uniref:hypothetical protein n=1 Tax=Streptomyces sp. NPDC088910 TaxID=3365911 RepID=UPI0038152843
MITPQTANAVNSAPVRTARLSQNGRRGAYCQVSGAGAGANPGGGPAVPDCGPGAADPGGDPDAGRAAAS